MLTPICISQVAAVWRKVWGLSSTIAQQQVGGRFMGERRKMLERLQHPDFLPFIQGDWQDDITAAVAVKTKAYPTPDS